MSKVLKVHLLVIDPQNDFCDIPGATLPVPGADADMKRLAKLVDRIGHKLDDIHVTLDSHRLLDIAHPVFWMDQRGKQPNPFTIISASDIEAGIWTTRNPQFRARALAYAKTLEASGLYQICIWPAHCLIGTWGHNVHSVLNEALQHWSDKEFAMVDYVTKGSNPWTEHYGALMAEVPDPDDPSTGLNTEFLNTMAEADIVLVGGEASSHCVLTTVNQIAKNIGQEHIKKFHLLEDCMSPVPAIPGVVDFPAIASAWLKDMTRLGMTVTNSVDFMK
ncbi:MAG: hypothetical protein KBC81_00230 [Candidatus Pacebacteria bacterium]|nr:hypothetical protein [Candidatus Paceibacterota bacterium]